MRYLPLLMLSLLAPSLFAQEPSVRLESRITGNRELPRVMYIVPWRQSPDVNFDWDPEPAIAGELFQPLRRDEYRRQLHYRELLSAGGAEAAGESQTTTQMQGN